MSNSKVLAHLNVRLIYLNQSFFRAFKAVFSEIGRAASEDVVLALIRTKCLPILLYSTEACPLLSRDKLSMEFAITRVFMKLFCTSSAAVVAECQRNFNFLPFKHQVSIRTAKFLQRFSASENLLCSLFSANASFDIVYNCIQYIVCSLVMGLILDQFVNLETQCIIAVISSIRGVSDVNNQDTLIYLCC